MYRTLVTICTVEWSLYVPQSGHYMYRTVVTICTAQWSLYVPYSGHYMYHQFNIQQFHVLPTQLYLCVLFGSENKQRLFPYTTLTDWFVYPRRRVFNARYELDICIQFRQKSLSTALNTQTTHITPFVVKLCCESGSTHLSCSL